MERGGKEWAFFSNTGEPSLFDHLDISNHTRYREHVGQHDVIYIDFSEMPRECCSYREYIDRMKDKYTIWKENFIMKKLTAMMLCATLVLGLSACGSKDSSGSAASPEASTAQEETAAADESAAKEDDSTDEAAAEAQSGKALVVYYSASGNTARVAQEITDAAGADLFEIVPTEVYTDDDLNWSDDNSRVSREHDDESLREVPLTTTEVENWDSCDTVLIGYPIW